MPRRISIRGSLGESSASSSSRSNSTETIARSTRFTSRGGRQSGRNIRTPASTRTVPTARKSTGGRAQINSKQKSKRKGNPKVMQDIKFLQNTTHLLIPRLPFGRLIREIIMDASSDVTRTTEEALLALQTAAETYMTQFLCDCYLLTMHRGRVTLSKQDIHIIQLLRGGP